MSDASQGPGWWLASDGKWYPPDKAAKQAPPPQAPPASATASAPPPKAAPPPRAGATPASSSGPPGVPPPTEPPSSTPPAASPPASTPPPVAPTVPASPGPAGPRSSSGGSGCLKAFLIVVAIVFVVGVAIVAVLAFVVDRAAHHVAAGIQSYSKVEDETGISTYPLGFDATHPPQYDVWKQPMSCTLDRSTGEVTARSSVQNHSGHASSYAITVSFDGSPDDVGGATAVYNVDPGATVSYSVVGQAPSSSKPDCKVSLVLRSDNPKLAPTTTEH